MRKILNVIFKTILVLLLVFILIIVGYFALLTILEYKPAEMTEIEVEPFVSKEIELNKDISLLLYNVGFAAYVPEFSFFFDGGDRSKTISTDISKQAITNIANDINVLNPDFLLLQEIDINTPRGGNFNQKKYLQERIMNDYSYSFAKNYYVPFLFIPITDMTGRIEAGLLSGSKYSVNQAVRVSLPIDESWPLRLGSLKRCLLIQRIPVSNGKELVVINGHLSAYDAGGVYRKKQLKVIQELLEEEYQKGNYVIIGADWNHIYPEISPTNFNKNIVEGYDLFPDFFAPKNYTIIGDTRIPTNRSASKEYVKGETYTTVLDWFYVSDNIKVEEIRNIDNDFRDSDHQPVYLKVKLK